MKSKNKLIAKVGGASIGLISLLLLSGCINQKFPQVKDTEKQEVQHIKLKTSEEKHSFISGEDFSPGRYTIVNKDKDGEGILFVRNQDGTKIASEILGSGDNAIDGYTVTLDKTWRITALDTKEFDLIPVGDTEMELSAGIWTLGKDKQIIPAEYKVEFTSDGSVSIFDKDGNETKFSSDDKDIKNVKLSGDETIQIAFSNNVRFILVK